jgi:hypothetical protein
LCKVDLNDNVIFSDRIFHCKKETIVALASRARLTGEHFVGYEVIWTFFVAVEVQAFEIVGGAAFGVACSVGF